MSDNIHSQTSSLANSPIGKPGLSGVDPAVTTQRMEKIGSLLQGNGVPEAAMKLTDREMQAQTLDRQVVRHNSELKDAFARDRRGLSEEFEAGITSGGASS